MSASGSWVRKEKKVKKGFGVKTCGLSMPVLMVGSYDDAGVPNVMTAVWGGTGSEDLLTVNHSKVSR